MSNCKASQLDKQEQVVFQTSSIFKNYLDMPVWQLRHLQVSRFIQKHQIKRILDIGCAEGTLINRLSRSHEIQHLIGIDMDEKVLQNAKNNVQPELIQESVGFQRKNPLIVQLYKLNALEVLPIDKLQQVELVTMIQFIEHIQLKDLPVLISQVFHKIRPPYIVITTPNQEFNVHFKFKPGQMRHPEHLFQWTRQEFQQFCHNISKQFDYKYEIFGVGQHVQNQEHGPCSQGAFFTRNQNEIHRTQNCQINSIKAQPYARFRYPFWKDRLRQKIESQLQTLIFTHNYSDPKLIAELFANSKIGKKLAKQQENNEFYRQGYKNVGYDENWVVEMANMIQYVGYSEQRNEVFYQYEKDEEEDQQMMQHFEQNQEISAIHAPGL